MEVLLILFAMFLIYKTIVNMGGILLTVASAVLLKILFGLKFTLVIIAIPVLTFFMKKFLKSLKKVAYYISLDIDSFDGDLMSKVSHILLELNYAIALFVILFFNLFKSLDSNSIIYFGINLFNIGLVYGLVCAIKGFIRLVFFDKTTIIIK